MLSVCKPARWPEMKTATRPEELSSCVHDKARKVLALLSKGAAA